MGRMQSFTVNIVIRRGVAEGCANLQARPRRFRQHRVGHYLDGVLPENCGGGHWLQYFGHTNGHVLTAMYMCSSAIAGC